MRPVTCTWIHAKKVSIALNRIIPFVIHPFQVQFNTSSWGIILQYIKGNIANWCTLDMCN